MTARTTVLREPRHREFLLEQRRDPVTHKVFAAGDRITRCGACLLPFLDQSWEAIGRTHCKQTASVALDESEKQPAATNGPGPAKPANGSARLPLQLSPIPISLREVPITLS